MPSAPTLSTTAGAGATVQEPLQKSTMWLTTEHDMFLEDVRTAGRRSRPKVDASRSAVTRFALARLASQMTPEQIVAELRSAARNAPTIAGRKRLS